MMQVSCSKPFQKLCGGTILFKNFLQKIRYSSRWIPSNFFLLLCDLYEQTVDGFISRICIQIRINLRYHRQFIIGGKNCIPMLGCTNLLQRHFNNWIKFFKKCTPRCLIQVLELLHLTGQFS